jgi:hypothetical protein
MDLPNEKKLFIISPIGSKDTEKWDFFNQVQRHLIKKVCEPRGYYCKRADDIDKPGIITSQIVSCLLEYDLVIADLTDLNPNVFYELAIRHAIQKPVILIAKRGTEPPFDIRQDRIIFYTLDLDDMEEAKAKLEHFIEEIESSTFTMESPLTSKINIQTERNVSEIDFMKEIYSMLQNLIKYNKNTLDDDSSSEKLLDEVKMIKKQSIVLNRIMGMDYLNKINLSLNERELEILKILNESEDYIDIRDISDKLHYSYQSVNRYLAKMSSYSLVEKSPNRSSWRINLIGEMFLSKKRL